MVDGTITVSVSNHYKEAGYKSELVTQGILGEQVTILAEQGTFTQIRQQDGYVSWVSNDQLLKGKYDGRVAVTSHFVRIYTQPDSDSEPVLEAVIGSRLKVVDENDSWYLIELPDQKLGWAAKEYFGSFPDFTVENIIKQAREFLGYQYFWGGRTTKGFDCSGFVQTVFGLHGVGLERDAWQQQQSNQISDEFTNAQTGDLLFFAKTPEKVTHVGIYLGEGRFIHASGRVKINSLREDDNDFSEEHFNTFVSHNRWTVKS